MKASIEVEVVERKDVINMIEDINEVFRKAEREGIDMNGYQSNEYLWFKSIRKDIVGIINTHMNAIDPTNER